jgi:hypothetical protein
MTHRAGVAWHKGQGKGKAIQGTLKGWMFRRRCRPEPEGSRCIRNQDFKEQLCLASKRTSGRIYRKALELEVMKRIARSLRIKKMSDWTLWRGRPHPKRKKRLLAA